MTTTSASVGFIDYVAFGLTPESLRSLRALAPVWKNALTRVVERFGGGGVLDQFVERTAELPLLITDVAWQREWMQAWYKLSGSGFRSPKCLACSIMLSPAVKPICSVIRLR